MIAVLAFIIWAVVLVFGPWLFIWAVNLLFNTGIAFTFWTWLAAFVLIGLTRGSK